MNTSYEEISKNNASSQGKTDSNLSNDSNHLGGIPADDYATKKYVRDYHNNKEQTLKEYIDEQDKKTLDEAKEYANSLVRNQDFSGFAKITDLNALNENLSNSISAGLSAQKEYTDTKIKDVTDDVNSNFSDVNTAITKLNENQTKLFQSVSDGKQKVAEAITDKGVETSANDTFDIMATNIRNIKTGGSGEIPEGYVNTSDATADASKILNGYTAYSKGEKVYGTYIPTPYSGTDTSDATATSSDIVYGKTAYAGGVKLVGSLKTLGVEEIAGIETEKYVRHVVSGFNGICVDNQKKLYMSATDKFDVTADFMHIVRQTVIYDKSDESNSVIEGRYIESNTIMDNNIYVTYTNDVMRKYRYSFEELGLDPNTDISGISLGKPGFNGDNNICLLCIIQGKKAHFYLYDCMPGNWGQIFLSDSSYKEHANYWHWVYESEYTLGAKPAFSNLDPAISAVIGTSSDNKTQYILDLKVWALSETVAKKEITVWNNEYSASPLVDDKYHLQFSRNDGYILLTKDTFAIGLSGFLGFSILIKTQTNSVGQYEPYELITCAGIGESNTVAIFSNESKIISNGKVYDLVYDEKTEKISIANESIQYITTGGRFFTSPDEAYIYSFPTTGGDYQTLNTDLYVYKTDFESAEAWTPESVISIPCANIVYSEDCSLIMGSDTQYLISLVKKNTTEIVAIKYKDKYYFKTGSVTVKEGNNE